MKKKFQKLLLASGSEEGRKWGLIVDICLNSHVFSGCFIIRSEKQTEKDRIRTKDRKWCYINIPSSIVWNVEVHHDWNDGGRMYLLSKEEHKRRDK